jgi:polysaccharide export outer membrane protein
MSDFLHVAPLRSTLSPRTGAFIVAVLASLTGCASGVQGAFVWAEQLSVEAPTTAYHLGRGDLISVQVWDNEKLSAPNTRVRPDGRIAVPLLGDVVVEGKAPEAVAREIEASLLGKQLMVSPRVTVIVHESPPLTVSVLGKVARAGRYSLAPGASVADGLASAGGLDEFAHKDRIFVLRQEPEPVRIRFTFSALFDQSTPSSRFRLRSGDILVVE